MNFKTEVKRIAVIGNACGGKTRLSRFLATHYNLPIVHIDQYQFLEGLALRSFPETIEILKNKQNKDSWVIDGYGPLDILENRFKRADIIILLDWPLWRHYWWAFKRTIVNLWQVQRAELPPKSSERSLRHIIKLFKTIHLAHSKMRPELLRILNRPENKEKIIIIRQFRELLHIYKNALVCNS